MHDHADGGHDHVPPVPGSLDAGAPSDELPFPLPVGFPVPRVPQGSELTAERVELGRHLFYDERLSGNETQSCATCHEQARAFTDGRAQGLGSTGELHPRGAMSLANVGYASTLTWVNPVLPNLERQALVPMFGEGPVELGLVGMEEALFERLRAVESYQRLFPEAFPEKEDAFDLDSITVALASFQRSLVSGGSAYDRYLAGDTDALGPSALAGMEIFFGEDAECFHCHGGFAFSDSVTFEGKVFDERPFHNTALYNLEGGAYPEESPGLVSFTGSPADRGRFRAPTLRNIAVTAPYMHDGSIATLEEVIEHYAAGGRTITAGPHAGIGNENPYKSEFLSGFEMTVEDRANLVAFLESLTDHAFLEDLRHANPW